MQTKLATPTSPHATPTSPPPRRTNDTVPMLAYVMVPAPHAHPTDGDYVREWYMARLGQTTTALLQLLARHGRTHPTTLALVDVAARLGVGFRGGHNSPLSRSIDRLVKFSDVLLHPDGVLAVPTHMPPINRLDFDRMVPARRVEHDRLYR